MERASKTKNVTETAELQEKIKMAAMSTQVEGLGTIPSIDVLKSELDSAIGTDYTIEATDDGWTVIANKSAFNIDKNGGTEETEYFDSEEWDKTAVPVTAFYWKSDTKGNEGYNTIIGYKSDISNYPVLKFPSRCKKIEIDDSLYSNGTYEQNMAIRAFTKNITEVIFPSTMKEIGSGSVGEYDFKKVSKVTIPNSVKILKLFGYSGLSNITIPNSVMSLTLVGCTGLSNITIPNSVTSLTLEWCTGLSNITIPNSVMSLNLMECTGLINVTIPESVTSIGEFSFYECRNLKSITIKNGLTSIGEQVFWGCTNLAEITIPNTVTSIEDYAFNGCSSLTSITIPNCVTSIGYSAFDGCSSLSSLTIPNSVTSIGEKAFYRCSSLASVTIPNGVTSIGEGTFDGCSELEEVIIPNSLRRLEKHTFSNCSKLKKIFIPKTVLNIAEYINYGPSSWWGGAFYNCSSTLQIYTDATGPNSGWENKWNYYSNEGELTVNYGISLEEFNNLD